MNNILSIEKFIDLIKGITKKDDLLQEVVLFLKNQAVADSVGIRLKENLDFPYYTTVGFSDHFIKAENFLCKRDECGKVIRNENGEPILECICGAVIGKKISPLQKYFTPCGSFNLPNTDIKTIDDIKANCQTRGTCLQSGYKSVVVIPIPYDNVIIGSIQLNSIQEGAFSKDLIEIMEDIAIMLGKSLGGIIKLHEQNIEVKKEIKKNIVEIISDLQKTSKLLLEKHQIN